MTVSKSTAEKVVLTRIPPDPETLARLHERFSLDVWEADEPMPSDVLQRRLDGAVGLYSMLTDLIGRDLLSGARSLKTISQMAVGVDNIDLQACTEAAIPVGHTPDVLTDTTADTAFALLAAAVRRIPEGMRMVREGRWGTWSPSVLLGGDLWGSTIGILGLGRIGQAVARRASGFAMEILYSSPSPKPVPEGLQAERVGWDELCARSDHIVLCAPLVASTHHVVNPASLREMKKTCTLVNIARGGLVDSLALAEALANGTIGSAALDVTEPEPLDAGHPLAQLHNCLVTPHIGSASVRTRAKMAQMAFDNLVAGVEGRRLPHCANPDVYSLNPT